MSTNNSDTIFNYAMAGIAAVTVIALAVILGSSGPAVKTVNVPVYSDVLPGHVIRTLPMSYIEERINGVSYFSAQYEDDNMEVSVEGFTSLHDALTAVRNIVVG